MIDPREYAAAIARVIPGIAATAVEAHDGTLLYEVRTKDRILVRLPKMEAVAFLDGVIAGTNLTRGCNDNSHGPTD